MIPGVGVTEARSIPLNSTLSQGLALPTGYASCGRLRTWIHSRVKIERFQAQKGIFHRFAAEIRPSLPTSHLGFHICTAIIGHEDNRPDSFPASSCIIVSTQTLVPGPAPLRLQQQLHLRLTHRFALTHVSHISHGPVLSLVG